MAGWSARLERKHPDGSVELSVFRTGTSWYTGPLVIRLSTSDWRLLNRHDIDAIGEAIQTDGCSGPTLQVYRDGCVIHDFWYRTHVDFDGFPITRQQADANLREYISRHSVLNGFSPMAHWRYAALRLFGKAAWDDDERGTPVAENPRLYAWSTECKETAETA